MPSYKKIYKKIRLQLLRRIINFQFIKIYLSQNILGAYKVDCGTFEEFKDISLCG